MKRNLIKFGALFAIVLSGATARAGLVWEQKELELHPAVGDAAAVGSFKYKNTGDKPVHIRSVHTSCGCTTTNKQKDEIAPGESGEITATFKIGASTGLQQKTVKVETDDGNEPMTVLTLRALIPQLLELRPSFVYWENREAPSPKVIDVKVAKELNARSLKVSSSAPSFTTKITSAGPNEFKIEVQPRDTSHPANATLTIQPDNGGKLVYATARVVNPAAADQ